LTLKQYDDVPLLRFHSNTSLILSYFYRRTIIASGRHH